MDCIWRRRRRLVCKQSSASTGRMGKEEEIPLSSSNTISPLAHCLLLETHLFPDVVVVVVHSYRRSSKSRHHHSLGQVVKFAPTAGDNRIVASKWQLRNIKCLKSDPDVYIGSGPQPARQTIGRLFIGLQPKLKSVCVCISLEWLRWTDAHTHTHEQRT